MTKKNYCKKVFAVIEASSIGFGVYSKHFPGITGYGKSVKLAKEDFMVALKETRNAYGTNLPRELREDVEIAYKYDF